MSPGSILPVTNVINTDAINDQANQIATGVSDGSFGIFDLETCLLGLFYCRFQYSDKLPF